MGMGRKRLRQEWLREASLELPKGQAPHLLRPTAGCTPCTISPNTDVLQLSKSSKRTIGWVDQAPSRQPPRIAG